MIYTTFREDITHMCYTTKKTTLDRTCEEDVRPENTKNRTDAMTLSEKMQTNS